MSGYRLPNGGRVDRSTNVSFTWDGTRHIGLAGDNTFPRHNDLARIVLGKAHADRQQQNGDKGTNGDTHDDLRHVGILFSF